MSIKKIAEGKWLVDFFVGGRGSPRKRKVCKTKEAAKIYERQIRAEYAEGHFESQSAQDNRKLICFIEDYFKLYGNQLRYDEGTKNKLLAFAKRVNNPVARKLTAKQITNDRAERLKEGLKENTVNNDVAYIKAMFNEMILLGDWKYKNPAEKIKKVKVDETELAFLTIEQIDLLLEDLKNNARNPDVWLVTCLSLATGARWMEAESIKPEQIFDNRVVFKASNTKGRRHRAVPIDSDLAKALKERAKGVGYGRRIFQSCYAAFRHALVKRCQIELPEGQMAHVLRHSFASHFIMTQGNIISLQKSLGHVDIKTTMRYAHLAPDYLDEVIDKNPLALLRLHKQKLKEERISAKELKENEEAVDTL